MCCAVVWLRNVTVAMRDAQLLYLTHHCVAESSTVGVGCGEGGQPGGDKPALMEYIYKSQIGSGVGVRTAFGERLVTFADYTVSGSHGCGNAVTMQVPETTPAGF